MSRKSFPSCGAPKLNQETDIWSLEMNYMGVYSGVF